MTRKATVWLALLGAAGLLVPAGPVLALHAGVTIDVHQDVYCPPTGMGCPNDYHVEGLICSNNGTLPTLIDHIDSVFAAPNGTFTYSITPAGLADPCYYKFVANWKLLPPMPGLGVPYCQVLHLGLLFDVDSSNIVIDLHGWWTRDGVPVGQVQGNLHNNGNTPIVGFSVTDASGDGQTLRIGNGNVIQPPLPPGIPIEIIGMDVVAFPSTSPPNFQDLYEGGPQQSYPWVQVLASNGNPIGGSNPVLMAPDSFFDVFLEVVSPGRMQPATPVTIPPGGFLVSRTLMRFTNNNNIVEERWQWEIHGAQQAQACCKPDGSCQDLLPFTCLQQGGTVMPVGSTCATTICPVLGACCYGTAAPMCVVTDQMTCEQQHLGQWKGPGTDCSDLNGDGIADVCGPVTDHFEFGDAPEGAIAYPVTGIVGRFPTCMTVGPAAWIQHTNFGAFFGPAFDLELDGNAGLCPMFAPYDADECMNDGDAGLLLPISNTLVGGMVVPCPNAPGVPAAIGAACATAMWGRDIDILVQNIMPNQSWGYVNVLMDWNQDGRWSGSSSCGPLVAPEHVLVDFAVPPGFVGPLSALGPPSFLIGPNTGEVWVRFSITERPVLTSDWDGSGSFEDGETEDYLLKVAAQDEHWDFGDAPDQPYPTLLASNGARHFLGSGLMLGAQVDAEANGQPTAPADGDDLAGVDDEDGVAFLTTLARGRTAKVQVTASAAGFLDAWIDYNGNGSWAEATDQIFMGMPLLAGPNILTFVVPPTATLGNTYARFRFSSMGGLPFMGPAQDGEVEDYMVEIRPAKVVGRRLFYNQSAWDGNNPAPNAADDNAIATDKVALLSGSTGSFQNYSSYTRSINGLMVDIQDLAGVPTAADFTFTNTGKDFLLANPAAAPTSVTVRAGAGVGGSDRVTIIWANNAIPNHNWLRIQVLPTANTGLGTIDKFYFGTALAEDNTPSGAPLRAVVNATDELDARANRVIVPPGVPITNRWDYNRDKLVNATDELAARNNRTVLPTTALLLGLAP